LLQQDGFGAQIQRILSVASFSNDFALKFTLKPISFAEDQITQNPLSVIEREKQIKDVNNWLRMQLGPSLTSVDDRVKVCSANGLFTLFIHLLLNLFSSRFLSRNLLIEIEDCYFFTKIDPDMYSRLKFEKPHDGFTNSFSEVVQIHVHMRFANFSIGTERYLDPKYYDTALMQVTSTLLQRNLNYKILIHTDFSERLEESAVLEKQISPETLAYLSDLNLLGEGLLPNQDTLKLACQTQKRLMEKFTNVQVCKGEDFLTAINAMSRANYLILSKSSFAFVAGVMNKSGVVYSPEYWINLPSNWIKISDNNYSS
jgi:hypothetical protein